MWDSKVFQIFLYESVGPHATKRSPCQLYARGLERSFDAFFLPPSLLDIRAKLNCDSFSPFSSIPIFSSCATPAFLQKVLGGYWAGPLGLERLLFFPEGPSLTEAFGVSVSSFALFELSTSDFIPLL